MTGEELFAIWAPDTMPWSPWVKPVLFAQAMPFLGREVAAEWRSYDMTWAPPPDLHVALIVNLRGHESVVAGLALASRGYFPVPLFNAVADHMEIVDTTPIANVLFRSAADRAALQIPPAAPPAFLIDSGRMANGTSPDPGQFDNRWLVLPQDFPSAAFLTSHGVRCAILVQSGSQQPDKDVAHILLRWQQAGISLSVVDVASSTGVQPLRVSRPWWFRSTFYRALAMMGLRRSSAGGFGALIPEPSGQGSGFG
jgi:hypothetical protein